MVGGFGVQLRLRVLGQQRFQTRKIHRGVKVLQDSLNTVAGEDLKR